jgi:hypothetical protein
MAKSRAILYENALHADASEPDKSSSRKLALPLIPRFDNPIYRYEAQVLKNLMRDYQPTWRIRSRMSPL